LQRHGLAPDRLTLEVTETAALNTSGSSLETLLELRYLGVQISIDDYGTGLSTLDYLKRIPATEIKIDKSFVQALGKSHSDKLLVHSTIQLAHSLGQKVVAEGIEDAETLQALATMGCDVAQGYFIGKPMKLRPLLRMLLSEQKQRAA
jgi:EAL domain-containing protein (putative c-di-GMP-specific phosphodiesterase class I)